MKTMLSHNLTQKNSIYKQGWEKENPKLVWEKERDRQLLKNSWPQEVATKAKADKHSWSIVGWVQRVTFFTSWGNLEGVLLQFYFVQAYKNSQTIRFLLLIVAAVGIPGDKMKSDKKCLVGKAQVLRGNVKPTMGHQQIKSHRLGPNMARPMFLTIIISWGQGWSSMHWTINTQPYSSNLSAWISSYRIIWTPISSCWPRPSDASQLSVGGWVTSWLPYLRASSLSLRS